MKVILLMDIGGVGKRDEVKEVADGYALNSLIPQRKAIQATKERIAALSKQRQEESASKEANEAKITSILATINGSRITISAKANEKGHLFKAVTEKDVEKALAQFHIAGHVKAVTKPEHIKQTGEYPLVIQSKNASADLTLVVEGA
jgi:large subunit ribosomal protein L9